MEKEKIVFIKSVADYMRCFSISSDVADFIGCQFALESDFGGSNLARKLNNFCGMKLPLVRITLGKRVSDYTSFAMFDCIEDCFLDYILCLQYHQPLRKELENLELFKGFIRWYCPERDYINKITNLFNLYQNGKEN